MKYSTSKSGILTPLGKTFIEPLQALYDWAANNAAALDELENNIQMAQN